MNPVRPRYSKNGSGRRSNGVKQPITYKDAGVDVDKANRLVDGIKLLAGKTVRKGCIGGIGGFSGFFDGRFKEMKEPVLAASTDGVGTKLLLANIVGKHDTVGIDLVAMCVNDIVTCGAEPLFFLDYFGTGKLDSDTMLEVMKGITEGCRQAGCSLIGGETAEMPGLYKAGDYDLAGFSVGVVDKKDIIDGSLVRPGDVVLGIASSGPHSNGYSLIRKVFSEDEIKKEFGRELLKPTIIYVKPVLRILDKIGIGGIAHITGGGFFDNIPRVLPKGCAVVINKDSWDMPPIFKAIQKRADLDDKNMYWTLNMGIGMVLIIRPDDVGTAQKILTADGLKSYVIGDVVKGARKVVL
jgi:phosphoribosylformylglycinamidine cyclo-ligase